MHTSSNNHIYFSEDDPFQLRYGKHAVSSLLQIVKFAWGFKEPTDEFSEEVSSYDIIQITILIIASRRFSNGWQFRSPEKVQNAVNLSIFCIIVICG